MNTSRQWFAMNLCNYLNNHQNLDKALKYVGVSLIVFSVVKVGPCFECQSVIIGFIVCPCCCNLFVLGEERVRIVVGAYYHVYSGSVCSQGVT